MKKTVIISLLATATTFGLFAFMALLKVMKIAGKDHQNINVKSWLFTIARNTLIDELRQQQKWQWQWQWQKIHEGLLAASNLSAEFEHANRLAKFNEAITALPYYQREAFIFQQEGFSVMEICQLTNESFETIKSRLRYARNNLKALMGKNNESR